MAGGTTKPGQLSFTWPFVQALVRTWARLASSVSGESVDVNKEFDVSVVGRPRQRAALCPRRLRRRPRGSSGSTVTNPVARTAS